MTMHIDSATKKIIDEVNATLGPRSLHRTLYELAHCYHQSADLTMDKMEATKNADFYAPAIMCKSFAIELLLKFFIVADQPSVLTYADFQKSGADMRGHPYSTLFDRVSQYSQEAIAKKHSERTGKAVTPVEFRNLLVQLGDQPFVYWRYLFEKGESFLDWTALDAVASSLGFAAQDLTRKLG